MTSTFTFTTSMTASISAADVTATSIGTSSTLAVTSVLANGNTDVAVALSASPVISVRGRLHMRISSQCGLLRFHGDLGENDSGNINMSVPTT